ncbi:MAG TPA: signal peptide peptidase SppA [Opitutaceae bacterium]|nr:signal peptide peptidase SppA [Opitutaceae bacterium]
MKNFFTSMLGALVALIIFSCGGFLLLLGILGAIASLAARHAGPSSGAVLESGSYLVLNLSGNITDAPPLFNFPASFNSDHAGTLQLRQVVAALRRAEGDSRIAGVLIEGSLEPSAYGSGYAALREVRQALLDFRHSGKPVRAFLETPTLRDYYVASAAGEIDLEPYSTLFLPGLAAEPVFVAGALEKYGVGVQVSRVGKYKSAVETFTRTSMSDEDRAQLQQLLGGIWQSLLTEVGRERHLTPAAIQAMGDSQGLIRADAARRGHLVDRVLYRDQVIAELQQATGRGPGKEPFKQIALTNYARMALPAPAQTGPNRVAVVYAEGEIVDGDGTEGQVGGEKFAREIRQLRQDDRVKAIVLRVNSPGGSVTGSEVIERELQLARKAKPVIVSMGTYAASGGYWISAGADRIFAEPTTVTGSIGVFDVQFNVDRLFGNFGVTFDRVKTGKFADADTITRPKTDEELAIVQREVDWIYGQFLDKVAAGRHLPRARVEEIAQGRVWSGADALKLGLVDEFGGLGAAVRYAAQRANLGPRYGIEEYPTKKDLWETLAEMFQRVGEQGARAPAGGLAGDIAKRVQAELSVLRAFNDPRGLYARLPVQLELGR